MKQYRLLLPVLSFVIFVQGQGIVQGQSVTPASHEGAAAVSSNFPATGLYVATNTFPRNTLVEITNLGTGQIVRAYVTDGLDVPGLLAELSREAAERIGLPSRSIGRIRIRAVSDPLSFPRTSGDYRRSGDRDYDPSWAKDYAGEQDQTSSPPPGSNSRTNQESSWNETPGGISEIEKKIAQIAEDVKEARRLAEEAKKASDNAIKEANEAKSALASGTPREPPREPAQTNTGTPNTELEVQKTEPPKNEQTPSVSVDDGEIARLRAALDEANKKLETANKALTEANAKLEDANAKLEDANKKLETANKALASGPEEGAEYAKDLADQLAKVQENLEKVEAAKKDAEDKLTEALAKAEAARKEKEEAEAAKKDAEEKLTEALAKAEAERKGKEEAEAARKDAEDKLTEALAKAEAARKEKEEAEAAKKDAEEKLAMERAEAEAAKKDAEEKLAMERAETEAAKKDAEEKLAMERAETEAAKKDAEEKLAMERAEAEAAKAAEAAAKEAAELAKAEADAARAEAARAAGLTEESEFANAEEIAKARAEVEAAKAAEAAAKEAAELAKAEAEAARAEAARAEVEAAKTPGETPPQGPIVYIIAPDRERPPQGYAPPGHNTLPVFSVPTITWLDPSKYYLQVGASKDKAAVEWELNKLRYAYPSTPLAIQYKVNAEYCYRILVGPVSKGEAGVLLKNLQRSGYKEAFRQEDKKK